MNSYGAALQRIFRHMSIVNKVDDESNVVVREDINADIMQANMRPHRPFRIRRITISEYAISVHDASFPHIYKHDSGVEQPMMF